MTPETFKEIRLTLGLSLSELAEGLRVIPRTVRRYENGERFISGSIARHMEEFRDGKPFF